MKQALIDIEKRLGALPKAPLDTFERTFNINTNEWTIISNEDKCGLLRNNDPVSIGVTILEQVYGGKTFGRICMGWNTIHQLLLNGGLVDNTNRDDLVNSIPNLPYEHDSNEQRKLRENISKLIRNPSFEFDRLTARNYLKFQCVQYHKRTVYPHRENNVFFDVNIYQVSIEILTHFR